MQIISEFQDLNKLNNQEIDCKMNANKGCLESWNKNDWNLTNSLKTPMGPVFDRRWEGISFAVWRKIIIYMYTYMYIIYIYIVYMLCVCVYIQIVL